MSGGSKPLDVGNGAICASFGTDGRWLSLGSAHPAVGFIELNGLPPFDEVWRGDPAATRRFRSWMTQDRFCFLSLQPDGPMPPRAHLTDSSDPYRPRWSVSLPQMTDDVQAVADERGVVWRHRLRRTHVGVLSVRLRFAGRLDLPALAEITEVNPPPPTGAATVLRVTRATLIVEAAPLPAGIELTASTDPPQPLTWELRGGGAELEIGWPANVDLLTIEVAATVDTAATAKVIERSVALELGHDLLTVPSALLPRLRPIVGRALAYARGCCALSVGDGERVILTDHRLLPLSWTRDAYYQAMLLLATGELDDARIVEDHLRWLWLRCERPDARWMRSHHADGRRKDLAFQIDQQLYPILELADFWRATGSLPPDTDWSQLVVVAWQAALAEVDATTGLAATTESAADDAAPLPFILSSQILLWYVARRLAEMAEAGPIDLDTRAIAAVGERARQGVATHLAVDDGWAYATDARGHAERYHDANDLPTALAPLWGFCSAGHPAWLATMRFAFSPANPGFFDGPFGGLGSLHTRGPWPLGDTQAWVAASLRGDVAAAAAALERLCDVALNDGMLPEAYDPTTGRILARHWFAWPGALLAALLILDGRNLLASHWYAAA